MSGIAEALRYTEYFGVDPSSLHQIETSVNRVYSNGAVYVKFCNDQIDSSMFRQLYPEHFVGSYESSGWHVMITRSLGSSVREDQMTLAQFGLWMDELILLARQDIPQLPSDFDVTIEVDVIRGALEAGVMRARPEVCNWVSRLIELDFSHPFQLRSGVLHGDPNFRNIVYAYDRAHLIDFDKAVVGPIEWDVANVLMVCMIAERQDLHDACLKIFHSLDAGAVAKMLRLRVAQTLIHTVKYIDFEGERGLRRRMDIAKKIL